MRRGRRKVENPETARRILAAAEQQFAARGLAGARTDDIAAAARANKAMLYYYFGDKQHLHRAVLENLFRQLRYAIEHSSPSDASPREQLLGFVNSYFDFLAKHPNYPRLVQREAMESSLEFKKIAREYFQPFSRRLSRAIERGVAAGVFRNVDALQGVFSIIGMTVFYFAAAPVISRMLGHEALTPRAVAARKRALLDFLKHGIFPPNERTR